jgi:iron complex outermembrane recepter protein
MSELINSYDNRATIRWKLLTGASAAALAAYFSMSGAARAEDAAQPVLWFEVDGQYSLLSDNSQPYVPPFVLNSQFDGAQKIARKHPPSEWDEGARITYQPSDFDWMFSLGVRYGKSSRHGATNQYTKHTGGNWSKYYTGIQSSKGSSDEKHLILDFQAGKDFGLGMFGHEGSSILSVGLRYAQFTSRGNLTLHSATYPPSNYYVFNAAFNARRSFKGIGPSLSWDASADLAGNTTNGKLTLDWGVNGALLFGRQRAKVHHHKTATYQEYSAKYYYYPTWRHTVYHTAQSPSRARSVTVPALGAYAGISLRYTNAKVTFGYRYDNYFGAIDGGIDTAKREDRSFNGPYASISIGVGN